MKPAEAALILAAASRFDRRTVGRADAEAWAEALHGLDVARCIAAVNRHYGASTEWLMPAHVRRLAHTTTDIAHGDTQSAVLEDGSQLCASCKGVHRRDESCAVLVADDHRWRKALSIGRQMPRLTRADFAPKAIEAPPKEVSPEEAARLEAERDRQLAALAQLEAVATDA